MLHRQVEGSLSWHITLISTAQVRRPMPRRISGRRKSAVYLPTLLALAAAFAPSLHDLGN